MRFRRRRPLQSLSYRFEQLAGQRRARSSAA